MHSDRLHYLDNLRGLAMLSGVLFHAALAYSPLVHEVFPTADRAGSVVVDVCAWFLHLFRMPLFFLLAGFFAARLVQRRGLAGMFRNRFVRIVLPFALCWPLVHAALTSSTLHAAATVQHPSPLLALIRELQRGDGLPQLPPGTSHLWFLYYLMFFYVLVWVARSFDLGRLATRVAALHPGWQLILFPLLLVPALAALPAPHPAPEGLLPQFWAFGFYGPFFAFGTLMHGHPAVADRQRRYAPLLFAASLLLYAAFLGLVDGRAPGAAAGGLVALLEAAISVWMVSVCLSCGRLWLNRGRRLLRHLADASYWTYVVHLPILLWIQYRLLDMELHWLAKFGVAVLLTLAACLLSYQLLVRPTVLGRLFGTPRRPEPGPAPA